MRSARGLMRKASNVCESICQEGKDVSSQFFGLQPQMVFNLWCVALATIVRIDALEGLDMEPSSLMSQTLLVKTLQGLAGVGGYIESVDICGNLEAFFSQRGEESHTAVFAALRNSLLVGACVDEMDFKEKSVCSICNVITAEASGVLLSLPCLHRVHENCCSNRKGEGYPACPLRCATTFQSARLPEHLRIY